MAAFGDHEVALAGLLGNVCTFLPFEFRCKINGLRALTNFKSDIHPCLPFARVPLLVPPDKGSME